MFRLNGWQRIGVIASVGWAFYIAVLVNNDYNKRETFKEELSGGCPSLSNGQFVEWRDAKTGSAISLYREGERSLYCPALASRAVELLADANIDPVKVVRYPDVVAHVLVPIALGWVLAYVLVYLVRWVSAGFRRK